MRFAFVRAAPGRRPLSAMLTAVSGKSGGVPRTWLLGLGAAASLFALEFYLSGPRGLFLDFRNAYYPAGYALRHGESLSSLIASGVMGFVNLPIVAYLFVPLTFLPSRVAALGPFLFAGLVATLPAYILLTRLAGLSQYGRLWLALLFLFNGPLIYSLKEGNTSHFVLLAFAGGLYLLRSGRSAWAGFVLAAAALLKLPLLLFGGFSFFAGIGPVLQRFAARSARLLCSQSSYSVPQSTRNGWTPRSFSSNIPA